MSKKMKLDRNAKIALGTVAVAGLWLATRGKKAGKVKAWHRPGDRIRLPSGAMTTLRLPAGDFQLVGNPTGVVVTATDTIGSNTLVTVLAADTQVPIDVKLSFVDVANPARIFSFSITVTPA